MRKNLDEGSNHCPIVSELIDLTHGIAQGDYTKSLCNGGLLVFYVLTIGLPANATNMKMGANYTIINHPFFDITSLALGKNHIRMVNNSEVQEGAEEGSGEVVPAAG